MFWKKISIIVSLNLLILGCLAIDTPVAQNPSAEVVPEIQAQPLGQMLPVTAKANMGQAVIELEVALTPEQQAMGLMYRTSLPDNRGMLFPFDEARYAQFWMKNVAINLDMIFLKQGVIQAIYSEVPPCTADPCPTYGPSTLVDMVIELRGGRATELGLQKGDSITIDF
ncbi:DUF192 domain-containing protein [Aphanothece hegewaldii CCALA 016]|uniref:DUF192 domain-containing protein n=1 Tax=Aphanothece hegewaldii CCALA 016 TaxID=2107694 RepID=A0A2T1LY76_9CHRO|nr:DUF192 domain-containing protein [Aphanothece hegewaldii]PSF37311.1 DUF192 domain-containing protein [Aphanothece hegewaldii CCALA 016]